MTMTKADRVLSVATALLLGLTTANSPVGSKRISFSSALPKLYKVLGADSKEKEKWVFNWAERNAHAVQKNIGLSINNLIIEYGNKFGPTNLPKKTIDVYMRIAETQTAEKRFRRLENRARLNELEKLEFARLKFKYGFESKTKTRKPARPKSSVRKPVKKKKKASLPSDPRRLGKIGPKRRPNRPRRPGRA
jgi:hypothetical protein